MCEGGCKCNKDLVSRTAYDKVNKRLDEAIELLDSVGTIRFSIWPIIRFLRENK